MFEILCQMEFDRNIKETKNKNNKKPLKNKTLF